MPRNGARDGARTRDLRRDRPDHSGAESKVVPTKSRSKQPPNPALVGTPKNQNLLPRNSGASRTTKLASKRGCETSCWRFFRNPGANPGIQRSMEVDSVCRRLAGIATGLI